MVQSIYIYYIHYIQCSIQTVQYIGIVISKPHSNTAVISKAYYFNYHYSKLALPGECLVGLLDTAKPLFGIITVLNTAYYII